MSDLTNHESHEFNSPSDPSQVREPWEDIQDELQKLVNEFCLDLMEQYRDLGKYRQFFLKIDQKATGFSVLFSCQFMRLGEILKIENIDVQKFMLLERNDIISNTLAEIVYILRIMPDHDFNFRHAYEASAES